MKVTVSRKAHFNAAHRLYRKDWSHEKNDEVFGKCNNPNFHGHNYELIVSVTGDIDQETGYVIDMKVLKDIIKEEVEECIWEPIEIEEIKEQLKEEELESDTWEPPPEYVPVQPLDIIDPKEKKPKEKRKKKGNMYEY